MNFSVEKSAISEVLLIPPPVAEPPTPGAAPELMPPDVLEVAPVDAMLLAPPVALAVEAAAAADPSPAGLAAPLPGMAIALFGLLSPHARRQGRAVKPR